MSRISSRVRVPLPPPRALALWLDTSRWPTWVGGFGSVIEVRRGEWPAEDVHLIWQGRPAERDRGFRGRVTEMVREYVPAGKHAVDVFDERLNGRQTVVFAPGEDGESSELHYSLDYELNEGGPIKWVFKRRELMLEMNEMLRRFATEAAEEVGRG